MRRTVLVLVAIALAGLALGCSPEGRPRDDGLHKTVPSVVGMSLDEASRTLQEAGYKLGELSPPAAQGDAVVTDQEPVAGTSVARGSAVDLVVRPGR